MIELAAFLSLAMRCAPGVHPDTAQDVVRVESGFQPYAIAVVGGKSIYPLSLNDAVSHTNRLSREGKNYSVGLMQINQVNFKKYGVSAEQLFDPCTNLSVFEKIITDCYIRGGDLERALSCYYSGNFETGKKKEKTFQNTSYTERIGYVPVNYIVPSTKADKSKEEKETHTDKDINTQVVVIYPSRVIRGDLQISEN
ncbi:lytic transglycosylase domain-containing protein [Pantoea endophytica]|uniref:Lytic transglycosylase domain-containing protein n=1 Tax=Pantoea sp. BJ2 TaxID=3141322 RepID=A0AAU7U439_9GAMM